MEAGPVRHCPLCSQYNTRNHRGPPIFGSKKVLSSLLASEHNSVEKVLSDQGRVEFWHASQRRVTQLSEVLPGEIFMELLFNFLSTCLAFSTLRLRENRFRNIIVFWSATFSCFS